MNKSTILLEYPNENGEVQSMAKLDIELGNLTNSCFVIMPFLSTFNTEYERVIKPAVEDAGLTCIRADEIYSKPQVMPDIWKSLRSARIVIAELTGKNTNVFYEVGVAHALGKPVIILTRNEDDVPFDLKALRYLSYNIEEPFWGDNLKSALSTMIQNLLQEKNFGNVFEGIVLRSEGEYEKVVEVLDTQEEVQHNLNGSWKGTMDVKDTSYECELALIQKEDNLHGRMRVSFISTDKEGKQDTSIVQEDMAGEIKGNRASFYGTSYSYIKQGLSPSYNLDIFSSQISDAGDELSGEVDDVTGSKGTFLFKKVSDLANKAARKK